MITFNVVRYPAEIHNGYWWKYDSGHEQRDIFIQEDSLAAIRNELKLTDVFRIWREGRFVYIVTNNYYYKLEETWNS